MACNENIIKNIANEVTRNCQGNGVTVEEDFVTYLIELLLLNPKYGKLFSKHIKRDNLEYFVNECVAMLTKADTSIHTLKMQFVMLTMYDKLQNLVDRHTETIDNCLRPLVMEIMDEDPGPEDNGNYKKLFRKIAIYIVLVSGLGSPSSIITLKESLAALESVFTIDDLKVFVALCGVEKMKQLTELVQLVSGVRLFNRDCKLGGDGIPDLPFDLMDASNACLSTLSNVLLIVMQKVNKLTTAVEDSVYIEEETGNVCIEESTGYTNEQCVQVYELVAFYRQYEVYTRRLLSDASTLQSAAALGVRRTRDALQALHDTVKYKAAVPVLAVYPLFASLSQVWRDMQNTMHLVSTVNQVITTLAAIQELVAVPRVVSGMLAGRRVLTDQERMTSVRLDEKLSLGSLKNYVATSSFNVKDKGVQFLGFCAISLAVGALIPGNVRIGYIKEHGVRYGFCNVKMAKRFSKTPDRYINEVINYARNNPHIINLLNIVDEVEKVKDTSVLVEKHVPTTKVSDKDIQTEAHPVESYIEKNYTSDLWKWKRRACQWATIVNCRTHSTQTVYSHLRSEIQCQTVEQRDKEMQTRRDCAASTTPHGAFLWGLRGRLGDDQRVMPLKEIYHAEKKTAETLTACQKQCHKSKCTKQSNVQTETVAEMLLQECCSDNLINFVDLE